MKHRISTKKKRKGDFVSDISKALISKKGDLKKIIFSIMLVCFIYAFFFSVLPGNEKVLPFVCAADDNGFYTCSYGAGCAYASNCDVYGNDATCGECSTGGGTWAIGGAGDSTGYPTSGATLCCGDDLGEYDNVFTDYAGTTYGVVDWGTTQKGCCNAATDQINYNSACVTAGTGGNAVATGYSGHDQYAYPYISGWLDLDGHYSWPAGFGANVCGGGTWIYMGDSTGERCSSAGGTGCYDAGNNDYGCCGDDTGENYRTRVGSTDAPTGYTTDSADKLCCDTSTDCAKGTTCTASTGTSGSAPTKAYCNGGMWIGGDSTSNICTAMGFTWLSYTDSGTGYNCCGDDTTSDDFDDSTPSAGESCCIDGTVLTDGATSGSFLCSDGAIYSCNSAGTLGFDTDHTSTTCSAVEGYYCNADNTWKTTKSNGCSCTSNTGECTNRCDNQTAIGLASDSLFCFSAGTCHGGSSFCNASTFKCEIETSGGSNECDDSPDNSCLTNSYCDSNCGYFTLTVPSSLNVMINYSYPLNSLFGGLNLTWADASSGESGYKIWRSTDNITFTNIINVSANQNNYSDGNLPDNSVYFYKLSAYSSGSLPNCSANTNTSVIHNITADRTSPYKPSLNTTNYTNYVQLNWSEGDNGLVLYLPFEQIGTTTKDLSRNKNDIRLLSDPAQTTGVFGNAAAFDGNDAFNITTNLGDPTGITLSLWFKSSNLNNGDEYLLDGRGDGSGSWWLLQDYVYGSCVDSEGNLCFEGRAEIPSSYLKNNIWYHVAVTDNATESRIYLDGILIDTGTGENPTLGRFVTIGTRYTIYGFWDGDMDEVQIYNRTLSQREIINLMQSGLLKKGIFRSASEFGTYSQVGGVNFTDINYTDSTATDINAPLEVSGLSSSSHTTSVWKNDNTVDLSWAAAIDNSTTYWYNLTSWDNSLNFNSSIKNSTVTSGLDGYDYACDTSSGEHTGATKDYEESQTTHTCTFSDGSSNYFHIVSRDNAGNWDATSADIGPFYIDTRGLSACSIAGISDDSGYEYVSGTTVYYNTESSGSFTVTVTATDATAGVNNVTFPVTVSAGSVDTSSAYTNTYSWTTGSSYSAGATVTCYDNAGNSNTTSFTVTRDITAPSGGSVSYSNGYSANNQITFSDGSDSGAQINSSNTQLLRRTASMLDNNSCGAFSSWSQIGSNDPTSAYSDTLSAVNCYEYRYQVYDNVMNGFNYTSANTLKYNNIPTHDTPSISPSVPNVTSNLTCNWNNVQDLDGHPVVNITTWYRNNVSTTLLYMPFEGGSNSTYTKDYSGYENDGAVSGATWNRTGGKIGGAYQFDGAGNDHVRLNSTSAYVNGSLSLSTWVKFNSRHTGSVGVDIFGNQMGSAPWYTNYLLRTYMTSNSLGNLTGAKIEGIDETPIYVTDPTMPNLDTWYFYTFTFNSISKELKLYTNGIEVAQNTAPMWTSFDNSVLNATIGSNTNSFNGTIDEIILYNYTLSPEQIYANYLAGQSGHTSNVIISNETSSSDRWYCSVTPNDGYQDGITLNSTGVTLQNLAPTQDTPYITPAYPNITSNLTCNWNNVEDSDGDAVQNITVWYKNNRSTMMLYLPFEGNGNESNVAKDYSGNGNNASVYGATWSSDGGKIGGAYEFDGIYGGDYLNAGGANFLNITGELTVSAWVYARQNATSQGRTALSMYNYKGSGTSQDIGWNLGQEWTGDYFSFNLYNGAGSYSSASYSSFFTNYLNQWVHIVGVYKPSQYVYLYINGQRVASTTTSVISAVAYSADPLIIGRRSAESQSNWNGSIDEVRIYNYTLSPEQIAEEYQAGIAGYSSNRIIRNETSVNDIWLCSVTPNDGYSDGTTMNSSAVTISALPTAPIISSVTFNPTQPNTTSDIQCIATPTYNESSTLTVEYFWYNGTQLILSGNTTGLTNGTSAVITTLGAGNTTKGENWNCTVISFDGNLYSAYASANVTIRNLVPVISNVILNSTSGTNTTAENLTVYFSQSDSDNDAVTNITDWRVNGVSKAVLYMPFDTNVSSTVTGAVRDYSTYGNNGTINGATWTSDGKVGGGYQFDGVNDFINTTYLINVNFSKEFSMSVWIKPNSTDNIRSVISAYTSNSVSLGFSGNKIGLAKIGCCDLVQSSISSGNWSFIVITYNLINSTTATAAIYKNGTLISNINTTNLVSKQNIGNNLLIGSENGNSRYFNGTIDEVKIYNISLSASQIYQEYLDGLAGHSTSTIVSQELSAGQNWSVAVTPNDGYSDGETINSSTVSISNNPPTKPILLLPTRGNTTYHDRKPFFSWTSTDADGDTLNYTINISFSSTLSCGPKISTNASQNNYTATYDFCVDSPINWTVRAYDGYEYSEWSDVWNFTIESFIGLNLTTNAIDFGTLNNLESRDTESGYSPLVVENIGNVILNISKISANASPFTRASLDTVYFRYKADNSTETPSFNWTSSTTGWTNLTDVSLLNQTVIKELDYNDNHDTAQIDINISVPASEPPGQKKVTIYIVGEQS